MRSDVMGNLSNIDELRLMSKRILVSIAVGLALLAGPAAASNLQVPPEAPWIAHLGADALLVVHIGGGAIGIVMGALVFALRKGGALHRRLGQAFLVGMLPCYAVGAFVAPFLDEGQRVNFTAGILALYLVAAGWATARRRDFVAGRWEVAGLIVALTIVGLGFAFMAIARANGTGTIDGSPPQAFILFTAVGSLAALGEAHALWKRRLVGPQRTARHLWRMGLSLFIASGSFFFGQEQFLPDWLRGTPMQLALGFGPLVATFLFLGWVLRPRGAARPSDQGRPPRPA